MCNCRDKPSVSTLRPSAHVPPRVRHGVPVPGLRDHEEEQQDQRITNVQVPAPSCCPHPGDVHRLYDGGRACMRCHCRVEW